MATRAAIDEAGADGQIGFDIARAVSGKWSNSL